MANNCIKVTIAQQQKRYFTGIFLSNQVSAAASAVATCIGCGVTTTVNTGSPCAMALDASGSGVVSLNGNPTMSLTACDLYNNSPDATATTIVGSNAIIEGCDVNTACGSAAFMAQAPKSIPNIRIPMTFNTAPAPDPFASYVAPTAGACTAWPAGSTITIGVTGAVTTYCNPPNITAGHIVTLADGSVVVITGGIRMVGHSQFLGNGATLYVTGGSLISATGTVEISAPVAKVKDPVTGLLVCPAGKICGPYPGVAFWEGDDQTVDWRGNNNTGFSGAIYDPNGTVSFSGTSQIFSANAATTCARVIAGSISLGGTTNLNLSNAGCGTIAGATVATQNSPTHRMLVE